MRLKKKQKAAVLEWMAEGLESGEINAKAAVFKPPFEVSRQQIDYYRKTRNVSIETIKQTDEENALTTGLSLKGERVKSLKQLAEMMEKDLTNGRMWLDQIKSIGSGPFSQVIEYEEFNKAEVDAFRGVLDDIAKEVGDRVQRQQQITWHDEVIEKLSNGTLTAEAARAMYADVPDLLAEFFRKAGIDAG